MGRVTRRYTLTGLVQGVGFRPYAAECAERLGITGTICNRGGAVSLTVTGEEGTLQQLEKQLAACPGARVDAIGVKELSFTPFSSFTILPSEEETPLLPRLTPDLPTCETCERELLDPQNRRYRYPFLSCVACGPRYSIQRALPYDRETTTMDRFPLCPDCREEYTQKGNRRRHAQTIACPHCGPQLILSLPGGERKERETALEEACRLLRDGKILAIKDIGGYHLAARPDREETARALRTLKHREKKPFAVLFPDIPGVRSFCAISPEEEALLLSSPRPIVLLRKKRDFAPSVCSESDRIGAMLPSNPLQILLTRALGPLILTSLNRSGAPMVIRDGEALAFLSSQPLLSGVLWHEREILTPLDDSVLSVPDGRPLMIRRARGYVPDSVSVPRELPPTLASGGDLKHVFALSQGNRVYLSQPMGDLQEDGCLQARRAALARMETLFSIRPQRVCSDWHPLYLSAREDRKRNLPVTLFQHHHAHALSVMAEHGLTGPVLGVIFDGTGYGTDGTVWGGEFLQCESGDFSRYGHLYAPLLPGGDAVARDARLPLWGYRFACGLPLEGEGGALTKAALSRGVNTVKSSSAGRLFDAVCAALGLHDRNDYEGECAVLLEQAARRAATPVPLPLPLIRQEDMWVPDTRALFPAMEQAQKEGAPADGLALGFHQALCRGVREVCRRWRQETGNRTVVLSGGCFCNHILLTGCTSLLQTDGFTVYRNEQVPPGDGGIALGQAYGGGFLPCV